MARQHRGAARNVASLQWVRDNDATIPWQSGSSGTGRPLQYYDLPGYGRVWRDTVTRNLADDQRIVDSGRSFRRYYNIARAAGIAIPAGAAVLPALAGGGAAAGGGSAAASGGGTAGWTMPGVTAPTFGGSAAATVAGGGTVPAAPASWASRVPWMRVGENAVNTLFGIHANRTNSRANRDAMAASERANAEAMAFEREQMAEQRRQFDEQQRLAREAHEATQRFESQRWAASEEDRLHRRMLEDAREARRAPFRQASADALARLPGVMASGRTSPGLASLGSYRRG